MTDLYVYRAALQIEYTPVDLAVPDKVAVLDSYAPASVDGFDLSGGADLSSFLPDGVDGFAVFNTDALASFAPDSLDGWETSAMTTTYPRATQIRRVPKDSLETIPMTFRNADGSARDVSTGSTIYFHASSDGVAVTTSGVASFTTDGSDGLVEFTLTATEAGTARSLKCEFEIVELDLVSEMFVLEILERAKV